MKKIIVTALFAGSVALAPTAAAVPAMCGPHVEHTDAPFGFASTDEDPTYVTACGGDSGPDAAGNTAIAPRVDTTPSH